MPKYLLRLVGRVKGEHAKDYVEIRLTSDTPEQAVDSIRDEFDGPVEVVEVRELPGGLDKRLRLGACFLHRAAPPQGESDGDSAPRYDPPEHRH